VGPRAGLGVLQKEQAIALSGRKSKLLLFPEFQHQIVQPVDESR
jgi:hypothetical protein